MVQIRKNVIHALLYLLPFLLPLCVIFGGKDVEEDTRYQSVQALLLQVLQVIIWGITFIFYIMFGFVAALTENSYLSIMTGVFRWVSSIFSVIPWILEAGLVLLAVLAFFDKTFRLPLLDSLVDRIAPKIYRRSRRQEPPGM